MFISWGSQTKVVPTGDAGYRHCSLCDRDSQFSGMVEYTVRHLYWVFRWVTGRTPYMLCGNCGGVHQADHDAEELRQVKKAIPLWDRRGWLAGVGGIGALVATGAVASATNHQGDKTLIAAPRAGDLYEIDLAQIMTRPEAQRMYSVIRVTRVDGANVEIEVAKRYYSDWRGVQRDIDKGETASEAYYGPERAQYSRASIQKMFDDGMFYDVVR